MKNSSVLTLMLLSSSIAQAAPRPPQLDGYFVALTLGVHVIPTMHPEENYYDTIWGRTFVIELVPNDHLVFFGSLSEIKILTYLDLGVELIVPRTIVTFTEVIALAQGVPSTLDATGFDPLNPQVINLNHSGFTGRSGQRYAASVYGVSSLSGLPTTLPGFNLTPLSGDPNSIVYYAQTAMPFFELASVPEPASWSLMVAGFGIAGSVLRRNRHSIAATCCGSVGTTVY